MRGQHCQNQENESDIRPLQMVEIGQTVRKQDAQRDEKHAVQHRVAANKQQEDAQKQQVVGHGDLGAHRHRLLETIEMRCK